VADVVDGDVELRAPEERRRGKGQVASQHVERRDPPHPLGDGPVLDPHRLTRRREGEAGDVAGRVNAGRARAQPVVDHHAAIDRQPGRLRQLGGRLDTHTQHDQVGGEAVAVGQHHAVGLDPRRGGAEVESHAVLLVDRPEQPAQLGPQRLREGDRLGGHDLDRQVARPQRGRHLHPDEAGPDDDGPLGPAGAGDDGPAVRQRPQRVNVGEIGPRHGRPDRHRAGGQEERVPGDLAPVLQREALAGRIDGGHPRAERQRDLLLAEERRWAQRHPLLGRGAGQVVLGEVRAIDRRRLVGAEQQDLTVVSLAPQNLGRRFARRAGAHDGDRAQRRLAPQRDWIAAPGTDPDLPVRALDLVAGQGVVGRRAQHGAGPQVEAGVVPRAADGAVDHATLGQRAAVVCAGRPHGEDLLAVAHQQDRFAVGLTEQRSVRRDVFLRDAGRQIRTRELGFSTHDG